MRVFRLTSVSSHYPGSLWALTTSFTQFFPSSVIWLSVVRTKHLTQVPYKVKKIHTLPILKIRHGIKVMAHHGGITVWKIVPNRVRAENNRVPQSLSRAHLQFPMNLQIVPNLKDIFRITLWVCLGGWRWCMHFMSMCGNQEITCRRQLSPSILWVLGPDFWSSGMTIDTFTC